MIFRLPRRVYRPLPEGQDWTLTPIDGEDAIVINEALDEDGRKAALKAAIKSLNRGRGAWLPLPVILAGDWLARKASTPMGSAVTASVLTAGVLYGVGALDDGKDPIAEPPTVVTVQPAPTPAATPSLRPSTRAPGTLPPTSPTGLPSVITVIRPHRSESAADGGPVRTPHPSPTRTASQGADGRPTTAAPEATTPPPAPTSGPTGVVAEPSAPASAPPQGAVDAACGRIALDVRLDPLLGGDVCLLG